MALITAIERSRMAGSLPALVLKESQLRAQAAREGIEYVIPAYGGTRTEAQVKQLIQWRDEAVAKARADSLKRGGTKAQADEAARKAYYRVAPASVGMHPVGAAFDIRIIKFPGQGGPNHNADLAKAYRSVGVLGEALGLRWGGRFTAPADVYHFELYGPREQFAQQYAAIRAAAQRALTKAAVPVAVGLVAFMAITRYFR